MYRNDFLKKVIIRIDFSSELEVSDERLPSISNIEKGQPPFAVEKITTPLHKLTITNGGVSTSNDESNEWRFYDQLRNTRLTLTAKHCALEVTKYPGFNNLKTQFFKFTDSIANTYGDFSAKRLGLRYIDNITFTRGAPTKLWSKYLKKELLGGLSIFEDSQSLVRVFSTVEALRDDYRVRFQYGMPNPDFPSRMAKKLFVLDTDVFCEREIDRAGLPEPLDLFHKECVDVFEHVITQGLRNHMGQVVVK